MHTIEFQIENAIRERSLATVTGGQILNRIEADKKLGETGREMKVVVPKSIHSDGTIEPQEMQTVLIREDAGKYENKLARKGDIVIKLSPPYDAAMVNDEAAGCLIPSFCALIRCNDLDLRFFVLAFLNSESCKEQLKNSVGGSIVQVTSAGRIKSLKVYVPEEGGHLLKEKCMEIGRDYEKANERLLLIRKIQELESERNSLVFKRLEELS